MSIEANPGTQLPAARRTAEDDVPDTECSGCSIRP